VELLLLKKKRDLTERELDLLLNENALSIFDKKMREQNGQLLEKNPLCDYFYSDFDSNVLKAEDLTYLSRAYPSIGDFAEFFEECKAVLKAKRQLKSAQRIAYNNLCWLSLYRKGEMLIAEYEANVLPQIEEVFEIQKNILLENSSGDKLRGKIDFIASFKDDPNTKFIIDNKTSSEAYKADSVATSTQLAIYCEAENSSRAAYVVLEKKIRLTDPKTRSQVIKGEITEEHKQKEFDKVEEKLNNIAQAVYQKKDSPKLCHFYGKPCEFYGICWKGDMSGLSKRPERV
jgi:CRISPR/Cas system-associated exonuclease Cas4 (RecB family)